MTTSDALLYARHTRFNVRYDEVPWLLGDKVHGCHDSRVRLVGGELVDAIPRNLPGVQDG